jgi:hypothetical protein
MQGKLVSALRTYERRDSLWLDGMQRNGLGIFCQGAVGVVGVVAMLEGIDEGVELIEAGWQPVDGAELVAPGAVAALDGTVELGALGGRRYLPAADRPPRIRP